MREGRTADGKRAGVEDILCGFSPAVCAHLALNRYLCQLKQNEAVRGDKASLGGLTSSERASLLSL